MSYLPARRPVATAGFFDFDPVRGAPFDNSTCFAEADARTADMFAKQQDLSKNWNPTGYYTPADMKRVSDAAFQMMTAAGSVIEKASSNAQDLTSRGQLMDARDSIVDQQRKGIEFTDAIRNAINGNIEFIESTGFKRWVIGSMEVAKAAMFTTYYVACNRSAFLDLLFGVLGVLVAAADFLFGVAKATLGVAKSVVDLAIAAGKQILKVPDYIATIITIATYGGAALGAWWLWTTYGHRLKKNPRRRRR